MGITVRPRGGGRELIGMAYMAGAGRDAQRREELAQRERADLRRLQYGAQQAGYDRLARERQLMFQAGVQGQRDEAARLERGQAGELRREQQLFDIDAANEEWGRRDEVNELQALQGEFTEILKQPWTEEQMQRLQATKKSLRLARESGTYSEEQMVDMTRRELDNWSMEQPEDEEMPEELTPEWFKKQGLPNAVYDPDTGRMYLNLPGGREVDFYFKPGTNGLEPVLIDEPKEQPEQMDVLGNTPTARLKIGRAESDARKKAIADRAEKLLEASRGKDDMGESTGPPKISVREAIRIAETEYDATRPPSIERQEYERAVSQAYIDTMGGAPSRPQEPAGQLPGEQEPGPFDPGGRLYNPNSMREGLDRAKAVQERQRWEAENIITPEEAAELIRVTSKAHLDELVNQGRIQPGDRFIDPNGTVRKLP
jgi:hypothetical protein